VYETVLENLSKDLPVDDSLVLLIFQLWLWFWCPFWWLVVGEWSV